MKYWGYLVAKLTAAAAVLYLVWMAMERLIPEPETFLRQRVSRFPQDLPWTSALLLLWLLAVGMTAAAVWDQRRRCRTCLTLLRMPVESGNWSRATIFSPPHTESICPFGHGTLDNPEVNITGRNPAEWRRHEDIWKELERLEDGRR